MKPKLPKTLSKAGSAAKPLLVIGAISLLLLVVFNQFFKGNSYKRIPREVQIAFRDTTFTPEIDEELSLEILSHPERYRKEFDQLIYDFNTQMLSHVSARMGLADSIRMQVLSEYDKHHTYLRKLYYDDFSALQDSTSELYDKWYSNRYGSAVEMFEEVMAKYACFVVNQTMASVLELSDGKITVLGTKNETPCGVAMQEALAPMLKRLSQSAQIKDFSASKGLLEERIEKNAAQLITYEVQSKKGLNKRMVTSLFGIDVSSTEVEIIAMSVAKIGFDLDKYFKISIDQRKKQVVVYLPQPEIIAHDVHPRIDKLDVGWWQGIEKDDLNKGIDLLRREFRRELRQSDAFDKAKKQAEEVMNTMIGPVVQALAPDYQLKVRFKATRNQLVAGSSPDAQQTTSNNTTDKPQPLSGNASSGW